VTSPQPFPRPSATQQTSPPLVSLVIPTYNERENVGLLVEAISGARPGLSVIIVDDGSPDGTGAAADELASRHPKLKVIHRVGKGGRGSACLEGFAAALADPECAFVMEMDADFSHDPKELAQTVAALERADVVIRSRYLPQSRIVNWSLARRVFSRLANLVARNLLRLPLTDLTNGYRAYSRRAAEAIEPEKISAKGYIVLSEIALQLHGKGFCFAELPTIFVNRRRGQSNLTWREIAGAVRGILTLYLRARKGSAASGPSGQRQE